MKNKLLLIIGIVVFIGVSVLITMALGRQRVNYNETTPKEAERGSGSSTVIVSNMGGLSGLLLNSQYIAVHDILNEFATSSTKGGGKASLDGVATRNDGTIVCELKLENPKRRLTVEIDRSSFDKITVKIPAANFSKTSAIYTNQGSEDEYYD